MKKQRLFLWGVALAYAHSRPKLLWLAAPNMPFLPLLPEVWLLISGTAAVHHAEIIAFTKFKTVLHRDHFLDVSDEAAEPHDKPDIKTVWAVWVTRDGFGKIDSRD